MNQCFIWSYGAHVKTSDSLILLHLSAKSVYTTRFYTSNILQLNFSPFLHTADVSPAPPSTPTPSAASPFSKTHTLDLAVPDVHRDDVIADQRHWTLIPLFLSRKHSSQTRQQKGKRVDKFPDIVSSA